MENTLRVMSRLVSVLKAGVPVVDATEVLVVRLLCLGVLVYELARALFAHQ